MSDEIPLAKSRRTPKADGSETPLAEIPVGETPAGETPVPEISVESAAGEAPAIVTDPGDEPAPDASAVETPAEAREAERSEALAEETHSEGARSAETHAEHVVETPFAEGSATGEVLPAVTGPALTGSAVPGPAVAGQVVYVTAPLPPKARGNRLVGSLLAVLGAIIFAALYGVVSGLIIDLQSGDLFGPTFGSFLGSAFFWVPGLLFLVGLVLLTLILNRAGWWAHVLGSLVLAIAVYFAMVGVLLLIGNVFHGSPKPITFAELAVNPWVIAAAIVAREVSIWIGLAIAARGRRVKARNLETRAVFDREQAQRKAEYERSTAAA